MALVKGTLYLSIIIQIITIIIGFYAYAIDTKEDQIVLDEIMLIENVVQVVEFIFYFLVAFVFTTLPLNDLAKYRYYDWVITTPLMLVTTLLYFVYEREKYDKKEKNMEPSKNVLYIINDEWKNIIKIVLSNAGMLAVGYMQEIGAVSLLTSNITGFVFLAYTFSILYKYISTSITRNLFWVMFSVWSLYGVASFANDTIKNASYNILDVISKNFYGLFLAYNIIYS
jgi:hypothetical protein